MPTSTTPASSPVMHAASTAAFSVDDHSCPVARRDIVCTTKFPTPRLETTQASENAAISAAATPTSCAV